MKLLIVDDNPDMRVMLRNICVNHFNEIHECEDGSVAITLFDEFKPDWVLMDIKMKKMDGITATSEIMINNPAAKVIIISQYKDKSFRDEAMKAGAVGFVDKEDLLRIKEIIKINN